MDLDDSSSPDEKEFPGLYERNATKSKKGTGEENESNSSENVVLTKKSIDSKKDKKAKEKKDRQSYEALGGESEEDDTETKLFRSPSKSKKLKTFKFIKKEKREKSREPETKDAVDSVKEKKLKEDPKSEKKKVKKDKKSKTSSDGDAFDLGGKFVSGVCPVGGQLIHFLQTFSPFLVCHLGSLSSDLVATME